MRLSTVQIFQQGIDSILRQQVQVQQTQQQLASGLRVTSPADDPVAAVRILGIAEDLALLDQYQRNAGQAQTALGLTDNVLADVTTVLQRVRELTVQANNATQTPETRRAISVELEQRFEELLSLANTRDASGDYLFAGFQTQALPFVRGPAGVDYQGDGGQRFLQLSASSQIAVRDPGSAVFMAVPIGNGRFDITAAAGNTGTGIVRDTSATSSYQPGAYTISFAQASPTAPLSYTVTDASAAIVASGSYAPGDAISFAGARVVIEGAPAAGDAFSIAAQPKQDMFTTLRNIIGTLEGAGAGPAQTASVNNALASGLRNLDQALGRVLEQRAEVGSRLNRVDSQRSANDAFTLGLQETLSAVRDLDFAEAISRLNLQLVALQAAQQSFVRIQGLSLFNFL